MQSLTISDIRAIIAHAPPRPPPTFSPTSASVGPYECPVCLLYQHKTMLIHASCMRTICAQCALISLDRGTTCPVCRGQLVAGQDPWRPNNNAMLVKPPPHDQFWMDKVEFECSSCGAVMGPNDATSHKCPMQPQQHQPPAYIDPWGLTPVTTRELVSNPPATAPRVRQKDHLLIFHVNGRQVAAKFMAAGKIGRDIKREIGDLARLNEREIA